MATRSLNTWWREYAGLQSPAQSLAAVRIVFGAVMLLSCVRFIALGWIDEQYVKPLWHFPYQGFEWVTSVGAPGMHIVFAIMTLSTVGIILGAWYRVSSIVFMVLFTYVELIDKTYYLNHYYFVSIMAMMMCLLPAHRTWSIDALRSPNLRADAVPRWTLDVIKVQVAIVYVCAGIAKINHEWLIEAMPLRIWMPANDTLPVIGPLLSISWMPWVFSWAGMLFDLTIVFWLCNKRTRPYAYAVLLLFHTITGLMFQIGVFPLVMSGLTLVFFFPTSCTTMNGGRGLWRLQRAPSEQLITARVPSVIVYVLAIHLFVQIVVPWRYLVMSKDLFWDEEGYRFGWRVMLMEKAGTALFMITDRLTGKSGFVNNADFLNQHQEKQMAMQPDMILQYAHMLHDYYEQRGVHDPIVTADVWVTLNGEPSRQFIDPTIDLSREQLGWWSNRWVLARH